MIVESSPIVIAHSSQRKPATVRVTPVFFTSIVPAIPSPILPIISMAFFVSGSFIFSFILAANCSRSCFVVV